MSLPLRYHIILVMVGINILSTAVLATFAFRTSRRSLEEQAWQSVGTVAAARQQSMMRLLEQRQQRMNGFLASLESLCGERNPSGKISWESECVHVGLVGFRDSEGATAAELRYGRRVLTVRGSWDQPAEDPGLGELAAITDAEGRTELTMRATRGGLALRARFSLADLRPIFQDRSGLRENGEVFLVDSQGAFLTPVRYPVPMEREAAVSLPIRQCLAGKSGEMVATDYSGSTVITGFRPASALGGCIVANLQQADALAPVERLARAFIWGATGFIVLGVALSFMISHAIAKPIARLAAAARAMRAGSFDPPARGTGPAPTEVRQLEQAFSTMAQSIGELVEREHAARLDAEAASRLKDEFLATLSHELRTPLNAILGWASIIAHGRHDERRTAQAMRAIERSARTQARLVDELLDVSRIIGGQMRLSLSAVWLDAVVDAAVEAVRPAAEAKRLELVKRTPAPMRPIMGDPDRLQQVMWNLLSNAVRFTPQGGRVEVGVREVDRQAEIRVMDTGAGIRQDFVPHVFERFRQADSSATRTHGGLGLGLAIVRHLVELHGGTVTAESAGEGLGATFTVRLPMRADLPAVTRAAESTMPRTSVTLQGTRVLVVDDDPDARDVLRAVLEDAGATVATTASAGETRTLLGRVQPHLLIADVGMAGEDGYSLIQSVRALESDETGHLPAIALTAHARAEDVERALASGFQIHVAKPVDPSKLLSTIATLVQH